MKALVTHLSNFIGETILVQKPISGGDISNAYFLGTSKNNYFLKVNSSKNGLDMFQAEMIGLNTINQTKAIKTPQIFKCGNYQKYAYLLMEYIEVRTPSENDFESLGNQLALLHKFSGNEFGFNENNFIGSLSQSNRKHKNWTDFYLEERILPQLQLALSRNFLSKADIPSPKNMHDICKNFFKNIKPSLLHGDLWGGNYLISTNGTPYLIDPAVYYGDHEMDIAMSKLFGGFGKSFYTAYNAHFHLDHLSNAKIELYQLYYLLVHLNLFGTSYFISVKKILSKYF